MLHRSCAFVCVAMICCFAGATTARAQAVPGAARAGATSAALPRSGAAAPFRRLAPGVETTIPSDRQEEETFSTHDIVELVNGMPELKWKPKLSPETKTLFSMASKKVFRREIWGLEFTFKPMRMMWVDVPQPTGKMQRKLIWYLVYHVKNTGQHLRPTLQADGTYKTTPVDHEVRFFPHFVLEAHEYKKAYLDRTIPVAVAAIREKEDPSRVLLSSVEMSAKPIAVSKGHVDHSVWGVATWEDLDPRIDYFSIYIQGLTNAYKWVDPAGAYKAGSPPGTGRMLVHKTLMLNFWRPGDVHLEADRTIHYGIPGKVDYAWLYR